MNGGMVIKYSANQKHTTDAVSAGLFRVICARADVPLQVFINRSDVLGGSTLGNISGSHVALNTVDIGLAQLAMHSPYEISPASAERDEGAVQRRDSVHPRRRISGTVTYRSASNHNRFWYVCSFLLASLMEKTALDFLPNTLILFQAFTIQNAPPFSPNPPP